MYNQVNKNIIKENNFYQAENSNKYSTLIKKRPIQAELAQNNKKY